ncbi:hypothetical protein F5I97DRAFT_1804641 [Phlebopus sp. FC_14]|nr:hypothetical protein F5I97DRAFT_1804641 [Phlebopus sp. FC_14]
MLLQWCDLKPLGPSNLAAIRFASPCRVQSVKIFPTGAKPFANCPDVIARTEPEAFFIDVYFNAHPVQSPQADGKHKLKAPNALIPTVVAYAGGQAEFCIDMGPDFATRLMILRGDFESVSMAIYGDAVSDTLPAVTSYTPPPLLVPDPVPISPALDPSKAADPTYLARQLLSLIPDSPSLNLVIRLMFCLKPPNDDWDLPEFPHLYSDLNEEYLDVDLESAFNCLSRPVVDDTQFESFRRFAERVADAIGPTDDGQAYFIAGILCRSASQHPDFALALIQHIDLERVFQSSALADEDTILALLDASANPDIARFLNVDWFKDTLSSVQSLPSARREVKKDARRLVSRLRGWEVFEDALNHPQGNFAGAIRFMKEIGSEEKSFGIWLSCMATHEDLLSSVHDGPPSDLCHLISLLDSACANMSQGDFVAFVKAYIGVASVLAVYAWSDSLPNDGCRERALGVLRLWQSIPGYREIVNHLLLLRQMTFRLECMTSDNDPPAISGIHAENIILNLVNEPHCYFSFHFVKCLRSWQPFSLTFISEEERISLHRAATIADDGLPGAVEELVRTDWPLFNMDRMRGLRVAVAVLRHELADDEAGDWNVLQASWKEKAHGLMFHLLDLADAAGQELKTSCSLTVPPPSERGIIEQLLRFSAELLELIVRLEPSSILTSRSIRQFVVAVADIYICTDSVLSISAGLPSVLDAGRYTRQTCVDVLRSVSESRGRESPKLGPALFLRTLLQQGLHVYDSDPAHNIVQISVLIDHLMPPAGPDIAESNSNWVLSVIPLVLTELGNFFRVLDVDSKCCFFDRLVALDNGTLNVGEWILSEEINHMAKVSKLLGGGMRDPHHFVFQYEVNLSLQFLCRLMDPSSLHADMCIRGICTVPDSSCALADTIMSTLGARSYSKTLARVARILASTPVPLDSSLKFAMALTLVRGLSLTELSLNVGETFERVHAMLSTIDDAYLALDRLLWEFGHSLSAIGGSEDSLDSMEVQRVVATLDWLCQKLPGPSDLPGLSWDKWDKLCDMFENGVLPDSYGSLKIIKGKLTPLPDSLTQTHLIPEALSLSIQSLESLLQPPAPSPSTPKRKSPGRDVLGLVALSPPTALLRSPAITGLTKTYTKNDFRELRQTTSARQNTSRLPSMHVDEFEFSSSPLVQPAGGPPMDALALGAPFNIGP